MTTQAPQIPSIGEGETRNGAVSFAGKLDTGELLTGTPTVVEETTTDLTLDNKAVNVADLTINGNTVVTGQAVQFRVSGQQAGQLYSIKITCSTDSSPAQTVTGRVKFRARS